MTTRERVRQLTEEGWSANRIARELGVSKSTVAYHRRRLGHPVDERCNRRYDWDEIQRYYDEPHTYSECRARFGFSTRTWYDAIARGALVPRPRKMPIEELLVGRRNRSHVRLRLIEAGLLPSSCEACGISSWRGMPLALELHHKNGDGQDNRLENLQILCPNCHSQTETWGSRNRATRRRRLTLVPDHLSPQEAELPSGGIAPGTG